MALTAAFLVILAAPSIQLVLHDYQSLEVGHITNGSPNTHVLKPTDLYFCSLKAKGIYARRSACERSLELQREAQHCASRKFLIVRIDHQLAHLQRMVLLTVLQKTMEKAHQCNRQTSQDSHERMNELMTEIAVLQERHINLTRHQSKQPCVYPKLKLTRDNLTETIAERTDTYRQIQDSLRNLTGHVENNDEKLNRFSETKSNKTKSLIRTPTIASNLTACNAYLGDLVLEEFNCFAHTLPNLQERSRTKNQSLQKMSAYQQTLQNNITSCQLGVLLCPASDVCDKLQTTISQGNKSRDELQQVGEQLAACTSLLASIKRDSPRCEEMLSGAHRAHHRLLINITSRRVRQERQRKMEEEDCDTQLAACRQNITMCQDLTAELGHGTAGCWSDLDKWKFRTDLCEGQVHMLLQNINATDDYIGDMRAKLRADKASLEICQDRQLYHRSGHSQAVQVLRRLTPALNSTRAALAACHARCPHLQRTVASSRCPPVDHGLHWHERPTGCYLVSRPGAGHSRMRAFCAQQAPGAVIARLTSVVMAEDAYAVLLRRYLDAPPTEPLRRQRRAWVEFEDGFEYAGHPATSRRCEHVTCACWTMRFPWRGRSQLYGCERANLPAICYVPLTGQ